MVAPVLVAVAGAAVLAGTGAAAAAATRPLKNIRGASLAILGREKVGKTTLLAELRQRNSAEPGQWSSGKFWIGSGPKKRKLTVSRDLGGAQGILLPQWKSAFLEADYVWYLFRADLVSQKNPHELALLRDHLALLNNWMSSRKRRKPKIVLVGTWADGETGYASDPVRLATRVTTEPVIALAAAKLGPAPIVVGSLATSEATEKLIDDLGGV